MPSIQRNPPCDWMSRSQWRTDGTIRDKMTFLFAVVAKLNVTAASNMSKLFAGEPLYLSHITSLTSTLSSICNWHKFRYESITRHGSLSKETLFLPKKLTNISIQRRNMIHIQQSTSNYLKFRMKLHEKLIAPTSVVHLLDSHERCLGIIMYNSKVFCPQVQKTIIKLLNRQITLFVIGYL